MSLIFVTTGTQFPFDRLLTAVDNWAKKNTGINVIAQSCKTQEEFNNIETKEFLTPFEYSKIVKDASIIVGHAGMGTIITAHENHVPLIIMPRKFSLNEHRNDHQLATVTKFSATPGIHTATDEAEMHQLLDSRDTLTKCGEYNSPERIDLIDFLKKSI